MARTSDGTYTRVSNSFTSPVTGTTISSTHADAFFDEIDTEMTDSLSRTGKGGMSADLDMNNNDILEVRSVELKGSTSGTATLQANATAGTTVATLPTATTTLVGEATTQTLTNKTISGASNTITNIPGTAIRMGSDAQGDVLYFNGTDYARLAPGTNGHFLKTQGAAADPVWASIGGGGDMIAANNGSDFASIPTVRDNLGIASTSVRVASTANIVIATALENGDTVDGVVLATNDLVLLTGQTAPAENGIRVVPASGAAARATQFTTYNSMAGLLVQVREGTLNADKVFLGTSNRGGTIDVTSLAFTDQTTPAASTTVPGIAELATTAETITGTDATRTVTPIGMAGVVRKFSGTISDDSVANIAFGDEIVGIAIFNINIAGYNGVVALSTIAGGEYATAVVEGASSATMDFVNGSASYTGTTGVDGRVTFAVNGSNGNLMIENRLGGQIAYVIGIFAQ